MHVQRGLGCAAKQPQAAQQISDFSQTPTIGRMVRRIETALRSATHAMKVVSLRCKLNGRRHN